MRHLLHSVLAVGIGTLGFLASVYGQQQLGHGGAVPSTSVTAADWPQWRGPNRDGAVASFTPPANWPERLARQWKVDVGLGYATPIVVQSRVYVFARQGEHETAAALDASTGEVLWRSSYPASFTMHAGAAVHGPGPKSTPVFSDGKLFTVGMTGRVTAFDAATGQVLWYEPGTGVEPLFTTHAFSPLVENGLVIVHMGGHDRGALTAFDVNTGDIKWRWDGDGPGYGSPIVVNLDGTRQIVTVTQQKLIGVEANTGTLLWERPYMTPQIANAQTPNLFGNTLIFGDAGYPVQAFALSKPNDRWTTSVVWENRDVAMRLSSAVLVRDALFGFSTKNAGQYFALAARTGDTLWTSPPRQAAHATLVPAGGLLFILEDDGELLLLETGAGAFEPFQRYTVAESDTWAPPVISGNRVFIKDVNTLALWTWDEGANATPQAPIVASEAPAPTPTREPNTDANDTVLRADILFWESIKDSTSPALFDAYLQQFPNGTFRVLAEARARELRAAAAVEAGRPDPFVIRWVPIPGGSFQMGCVAGDDLCRDDEKPRHWVDVAGFRMMATDVTVAMYRAYAERTGQPMLIQPAWNTADDLPVVNSSWDDAVAFCQTSGWRLPTEAEWEYAARGGVDGAIYTWGNEPTPMVDGRAMANVADETGRRRNAGWTDFFAGYDDRFANASPVGTFSPNAFGLYDMSGNVTHWTHSLYRPYPYQADDGREDPDSRDRRVLRGGTYVTAPRGIRVSYRVAHDPEPREDYHGFRCVQSGP